MKKGGAEKTIELIMALLIVSFLGYAGGVFFGLIPTLSVYAMYGKFFGAIYLAAVTAILYSSERCVRKNEREQTELSFSILYKKILSALIGLNVLTYVLYKFTPQSPDLNNIGNLWLIFGVSLSVLYIFAVYIYVHLRISFFKKKVELKSVEPPPGPIY